jgi:hypothetical protein
VAALLEPVGRRQPREPAADDSDHASSLARPE